MLNFMENGRVQIHTYKNTEALVFQGKMVQKA
jgi:hypothetical protein